MQQKNNDNQRSGMSSGRNSGGRAVRISARQRNHEDYRLPASLSHLPPMPLYLAVAHYALLAQEPVSRQAISGAFRISTRRALEVMRYLLNAHVGVMCARLPPLPEVREQGYRIQVWGISSSGGQRVITPPSIFSPIPPEAAAMQAEHVDKPRTRLEKERACQDMRRWFLQRPNRE
ncbi:CaiF/GrlA family transcriptional regulator [Serratia ureilytica]|uniref:CaiF/GrlA family transcriptional regulator n=1 Tax=Serratia ureilytica TaxID=300181 RepID=UPI0034C617E5